MFDQVIFHQHLNEALGLVVESKENVVLVCNNWIEGGQLRKKKTTLIRRSCWRA